MASETVNTVTGELDVNDLGVTLMHEHLLIGYPGWEAHTLMPGPDREVWKFRKIESFSHSALV